MTASDNVRTPNKRNEIEHKQEERERRKGKSGAAKIACCCTAIPWKMCSPHFIAGKSFDYSVELFAFVVWSSTVAVWPRVSRFRMPNIQYMHFTFSSPIQFAFHALYWVFACGLQDHCQPNNEAKAKCANKSHRLAKHIRCKAIITYFMRHREQIENEK